MSRLSTIDWDQLVAAAREAREHAYAPYSNFTVGAAVLGESGHIYAGCNVENASFGLTICAERNAIAAMVAAGERSLRALAVVTGMAQPVPPCGACRQVIAEFADDCPVYLVSAAPGTLARTTTLAKLLPEGFRASMLTDTPPPGR